VIERDGNQLRVRGALTIAALSLLFEWRRAA